MHTVNSFEGEMEGMVIITASGDVSTISSVRDNGDVTLTPFLVRPGINVEDSIDEVLSRSHAILTEAEAEEMFSSPLAAMREAGLLNEAAAVS